MRGTKYQKAGRTRHTPRTKWGKPIGRAAYTFMLCAGSRRARGCTDAWISGWLSEPAREVVREWVPPTNLFCRRSLESSIRHKRVCSGHPISDCIHAQINLSGPPLRRMEKYACPAFCGPRANRELFQIDQVIKKGDCEIFSDGIVVGGRTDT